MRHARRRAQPPGKPRPHRVPRAVALVAALAAWASLPAGAAAAPVADAVADLSDWSPQRDGALTLHGEWAVAWNRFVDPGELTGRAAVQDLPGRIRVPDYGRIESQGGPPARSHHATYALVLDFGESGTRAQGRWPSPVSIELPRAYSASRVFVDGRPAGGYGRPARSAGKERMGAGPLRATFQPPRTGTVVLVVHRSNHHLLRGGLLGRPLARSATAAVTSDLRLTAAQIPVLGGGLAIVLIFSTLYFRRRSETSFGLFALLTIALVFQVLLTTDAPQRLGLALDYELFWRAVQVAIPLGLGLFYHFLWAALPQLFPRWPVKPLWLFCGLSALSAVILPVPVAHGINLAAQAVLAALSLALLIRALTRAVRGDGQAAFTAVAIAALLGPVLHDIAYFQHFVPQIAPVRQWGILAFLLLMAFFLIWRYRQAFAQLDRLSAQLQDLNARLEQRVTERTRELAETNAQLEAEKQASEARLGQLRAANRKIADSLAYASRMQRAALPASEPGRYGLDAMAVWWQPRDAVGGDSYVVVSRGDLTALVLIDCTGHGVPGAFISVVAQEAVEQSLADSPDWRPAGILAQLDDRLRARLHRDDETVGSATDDGCEAGVAVVDTRRATVGYAGVGIDLIAADGAEAARYRGVRGGLGYASLALPAPLADQHLAPGPGTTLALASDGIVEQPGGPKGLQLGRRRFARLLTEAVAGRRDLDGQAAQLQRAFADWQGDRAQRDDCSLILWRVAAQSGGSGGSG